MHTSGVRVDLIRDPATVVWIQRFLDRQGRPRPTLLAPSPGPGLAAESTWFGAVDDSGDVMGCVRLIESNSGTLPLLASAEIDPEARRVIAGLGSQVSEISDLAVADDAPVVSTVSLLARSTVQHAVAAGRHSYLVAELPARLIRFLRTTLDLPCEIIGTAREYSDGQPWWPVMIDGVRWLHDLRFERPEQWRWFVEDVTIDLGEREPDLDLNELI